MCKSCGSDGGFNRREFIKFTGAAAALGGFWSIGALAQDTCSAVNYQPLPKKRTKVAVLFIVPPADVKAGINREKFRKKIDAIGAAYSLDLDYRKVVFTPAQALTSLDSVNAAPPDALLIVNFGEPFPLPQMSLPTIVCQPPSGNPNLKDAPGVVCIDAPELNSLENWDALESALAAANAKNLMAQSRLLCIANITEPAAATTDKNLGTGIVALPPDEYIALFDSIKADDALVRDALAFKKKATATNGVEDRYFIDGFRAHKTVLELMKRHAADAITIFCLHLKDRRPCISFSLNNSARIPCACEDDRAAAMTMMIGSRLFQRGGFQHNQRFYPDHNQYGGCHCTCPLEMRGPGKTELPFSAKPYPHQPPPSVALDVLMPAGDKAFITKYIPKDSRAFVYTGTMAGPPATKAPNDCETGFVMDVDKIADVRDIYRAPHPILYFGGAAEAKRMEMFARLARLRFTGNV